MNGQLQVFITSVEHRERVCKGPPAPMRDAIQSDAKRRFHELAQAHEAELYRIALRLCGNPADARDLLQDTFERGLKAFGTFQFGTNSAAWLATILNHLYVDWLRLSHRRQPRPEELTLASMPDPTDEARWSQITPEQVDEAVAKLPEEFRQPYQLQTQGLGYLQIAAKLGIPRATVATRLLRARRRLRDLLMPHEPGEPT